MTKFRFKGVSALQFLRIWERREEQSVRDDEDAGAGKSARMLYHLGVEVLLSPNATGEYIIYPAQDQVPTETIDSNDNDPMQAAQSRNSRITSYYIFAEGLSPYLLGRGRTVNGFANDTTVVVPCISAKYDQYVKLSWKVRKALLLSVLCPVVRKVKSEIHDESCNSLSRIAKLGRISSLQTATIKFMA